MAAITALPPESNVNAIGVVVDYQLPIETRGSGITFLSHSSEEIIDLLSDFTCTIRLQDPSYLGSTHHHNGVQVRMFRLPHQMPQSVEIGDIVMVRGAKWKYVAGNMVLTDPRKTADYVFFSSSSIPDQAFKAPHVADDRQLLQHSTLPGQRVIPPSAVEQDYIIKLREWAKTHEDVIRVTGFQQQWNAPQPQAQVPMAPRAMANTGSMRHQLPPRPNFAGAPHRGGAAADTDAITNISTVLPPRPAYQGPSRGMKFANLKDIRVDTFHDLVGEVRKMWDQNYVIDVYITDYTFNAQLFDYKENGEEPDEGREGDPYGYTNAIKPQRQWQGPWGKHTILVSVWEPHANFVRNEIREGEIIKLSNVRCHVKGGLLQGSLHEDRSHPDRVGASKLSYTHEQAQMVNAAKDEYWAARSEPKNMPKAQMKKEKKEKRKREKERREAEEERARKKAREQEADEAEGDGLFVEDTKDKLNPRGNILLICPFSRSIH